MTNKKILNNITILYIKRIIKKDEKVIKLFDSLDINIMHLDNIRKTLSILENSNENINLILINLEIPKIDILFIKKINEIYKDIPIIIMIHYQKTTFLNELSNLNIHTYIFKPINISQLEKTIINTIKLTIIQRKILNQEKELNILINKNQNLFEIILKQSKFISMGELIDIIIHQWNQPLVSIKTAIFNIKYKLNYKIETKEQKKFLIKKLNKVDFYLETLNNTLYDFKNFFSTIKTIKKSSINETLDTAIKIIGKKTFKLSNIKIKKNYLSKDIIEMYQNEIVHVFLNILKNAYDKLSESNIKNPIIFIETKDLGKNIQINILDNGNKIEVLPINKIFEPYFTTKKDSNGTGIGLYLSKVIIENHHSGKLLASNIKNAVCFTIILRKNLNLKKN
jgi:signal transduction histidine kinase